MHPAKTPIVTRRNGKQQSCEPCRRRKVACSHEYPICEQCRKRNLGSACVYVTPSAPPAGPRSRRASRDSPVQPPRAEQRANLEGRSSPGYLGPTSFSAVFKETQGNLSAAANSPNESFSASNTGSTPVSDRPRKTLSEADTRRAIEVLRQLPTDERSAMDLFRGYIGTNDCWIPAVTEKLLSTTYQAFGTCLSDRHHNFKLREMVDLVSMNTSHALVEREEQMHPTAWLDTFSGRNLRWESLAILFAYLAFGAINLHSPEEDTRSIIIPYRDCCSACISWANVTGNANTLVICALYKRSILTAILFGDASLPYWKDHSETVAMLIFLGLHARAANTIVPYQPTILSEIRRRLFSQIYIMDKVIAAFAGRPPLLAWRFCTTPLPTDIDDSDLLWPQEDSVYGRRSLSHMGSKPAVQVRASTIQRVRTMISVVREEILGYALGHTDSWSPENILGLKSRENEIYSEIPPHVLYRSSEDPKEASPSLFFTKLLIRVEHLLNVFFLERLLSIKVGGYGIELLAVSFEMVALTVMLWMHKDRLAGLQSDFELLLMGHGAPAAGILCNELVSPHPVLPRSDIDQVAGMPLSRSSIIQQLSLLVGFFNWVGPSQPNSDLARTVKVIVQHVLDQTLNGAGPTPNIDFGHDVTTDDFFNFDLLDTFDWFRNDVPTENMPGNNVGAFGA